MQSSQENSTHSHVVLRGILYEIINPVFSDWNSQVSPAPSNLSAITDTQESRKCTRKSACWAGTKYSQARISGLRSVASHSDSTFSLLYAAFTDTHRSTFWRRQGRAQNIARRLLFIFCLIIVYFWLGGFPWIPWISEQSGSSVYFWFLYYFCFRDSLPWIWKKCLH